MAGPSVLNPIKYINERQFSDNYVIKWKLFKERLSSFKNFYRKDLLAHYGCVNAIEFSSEGEFLVSGGDDRRVLLWSMPHAMYDQKRPIVMNKTHNSNIFTLAFDSKNTKIYSGGNDDQVIIHEIHTGDPLVVLPHRKPVYGLSVNPRNDDIIATAGDDGRILLYDIREQPQEAQVLAKLKSGFHSVMFNPVNPRFVVSANSDEGIALWDCRKPGEELLRYDSFLGKTLGISACFNSNGKQVLALRRRLPPVLYNTESEEAICQFYHPQYYNSCTMKTCSFAGQDDEFVLSGSDDFHLYMWRIPEDKNEWGETHMVLRGHRSIVNQVRYNKHNNLIASSGVEKMVKLWSIMPIGTWRNSYSQEFKDPHRLVYSHQDYAALVGSEVDRINHDYSDQSIMEDSKMIAFFDSLIQREIETWVTDTEDQISESDSDQDYPKSSVFMYKKSKDETGALKSLKVNRIAKLIAKKRRKLAKMARRMAPSTVQRKKEKCKKFEQPLLKERLKDRFNGASKKSPRKNVQPIHVENKSVTPNKTRSLRYLTRQCLREQCENVDSNSLLNTPSTSTGITNSESKLYRIVEEDSDEETLNGTPEDHNDETSTNEVAENLVNIIPMPLNGTQEHVINSLEFTPTNNGETANVSDSNINVITIRNNEEYNNGASTSRGTTNGHVSSKTKPSKHYSSDSEEDCPAQPTANGHSVPYTQEATSDSDFEEEEYCTPKKKRRTIRTEMDSGYLSTESKFMSKYVCFNTKKTPPMASGSKNGYSSEEEVRHERFRKRARKAKVNLRKNAYADSDSN